MQHTTAGRTETIINTINPKLRFDLAIYNRTSLFRLPSGLAKRDLDTLYIAFTVNNFVGLTRGEYGGDAICQCSDHKPGSNVQYFEVIWPTRCNFSRQSFAETRRFGENSCWMLQFYLG